MNMFTVYRTDAGVELRQGCEDYPNRHAIYSGKSYEAAYHFAQIAARLRGAVMRDYSCSIATLASH
jgi:hypothetical protein